VFFETSIMLLTQDIQSLPFRGAGDPENLLNSPYSIVLTEKLAKKVFWRCESAGEDYYCREQVPVNGHRVIRKSRETQFSH
jgi:hypothetical protein